MSNLANKIDFAVIFSAKNANPNGDPLNANRPRQNYDGLGEVSDVCLKRKLRNRLQEMGESIFVQSDENRKDDCRSLKDRYAANVKIKQAIEELKKAKKNKNDKTKAKELDNNIIQNISDIACETWFDVRSFGQVFAFEKSESIEDDDNTDENKDDSTQNDDNNQDAKKAQKEKIAAVSIGIRGPVTIQSAFSIEPITIESLQITKSVNLKTDEKNPNKKGSDTMGMKHRVDKAVYVTYGAINTQLASKTGFSAEDAEKIKEALRTLFVNDASSARPEGSMEVLKVIWWKHNCPTGQYSTAKVHGSLGELLQKDGSYDSEKLKGKFKDLEPEEIDGE